ncbi:PMS1 1 [Portunus trituberculatus]|uniref:PMS1 1 n=1 Tax=Portunus trituberculatus TaxID=210409 RepID=A0A5B7I6F9_PORTR|nr:PMS1 1 [Portunus trituberculatus]
MVVQELSQDTVRLIKSTQVITTPVSIVKELLENSIDAGAASVTIRLSDGLLLLCALRGIEAGSLNEEMVQVAILLMNKVVVAPVQSRGILVVQLCLV